MAKSRAVAIMTIFAVIFGLLAAGSMYWYLKKQEEAAKAAALETTNVVVAAIDIPAGSRIIDNQAKTLLWPKASVPVGTAQDPKPLVGRLVISGFAAGEPIVEGKLAPPEGGRLGVMTYLIPTGMRAMTVAVDQVVGVGGFLQPDSRVDVVTTVQPPRGNERISKIVLQDVRVLAIGQTVEQKEGKPVTVPNVTLALTPEDSEKLAIAGSEGKLQLVLRNVGDKEVVATSGATVPSLLTGSKVVLAKAEGTGKTRRVRVRSAAPREAPPPSSSVEIYRGSPGGVTKSQESFTQDSEGNWRKSPAK